MSEAQANQNEQTATGPLKLNGLYAFKVGMTSYVSESGAVEAVTVLRYEPMVVSQLKTKEKDGYTALQLAAIPKKAKRTSKAEKNRLKGTGFENGAKVIREIRQEIPEGATVGSKVDINSVAVGDKIKITGTSKGKGFAGVMKRWNAGGGPASHGSGFKRSPGSSGNRTWPGRVMPGKKFPGHLGNETKTINSQVVDVLADEGVIVVRGPVPGAMNSLVKLTKV